jgi:error-prone DNA polymerase
VPLWCKSNYSFLEGASHPEELVEQASRFKLPAIALTDRDGIYGVVRAHEAVKEHGGHLIIGSEMTVDDGSTIVLYARGHTGYRNLCTLISAGRLRNPKGISSVRWEEVCAYAEDMVAIVPAGTVLKWVDGDPSRTIAFNMLNLLHRAYGTRLFIGISRHYTETDARAEAAARAFARPSSAQLSALPAIPLVAFQEILYHHPERRPLQDVLTCIRHGCTIHEVGDRLKQNAEYFLPAHPDMLHRFRDDPALLARSVEIARQCTFSLDDIVYRYPSEQLPAGYTTAKWLRQLTFRGAHDRYPKEIPRPVGAQLERELSIIEDLDYCGYFLTMWEIVRFCRRKGILCQGRGSAANSAVCYCLGITAVDPVRMDLLFERFLSRERAEPPDIDLDIEHNRREEVIQHMYGKYGRSHAAMVANVIRYRRKSAVRDIGKVLDITASATDRLARLVSYRDGNLDEAIVEAGLDPGAQTIRLLSRLVGEILDFPRHLSIHPGGFMLGSEPISHIVPVENATMPDRTVIQWDKYDIESMNLFKVDLLGLGALTHLDYSFRLLKQHQNIDLSMATIPSGDPETYAMITASDTVGVFQLESRAQMAMLPRIRPLNYYDIVIEVSIVRPGPISGGMVHPYLRRRHGEEAVVYAHPDLIPVLKKTLGVPIFQEQVMKIAVIAAGYTPGQADQLRRDMAAWRKSGRIEKHHDRLVSGMVERGIDRRFAEQVFDQIRGFGEYGFPESHAASFALIAYATAWMRCHHPAIFSCALLNAWPMGFYHPATLVEDAKRNRVEVRPVDILTSNWECTLEPNGSATRYAIRMGFRYVKGLGTKEWDRIRQERERLSERDSRPFPKKEEADRHTPPLFPIETFIRESGLDESALGALARSGAFESCGIKRRDALWKTLGRQRTGRSARDNEQTTIDMGFDESSPAFDELTTGETIGWDYASSSHSTEGHPLEPYRQELIRQGLPDAREVIAMKSGTITPFAGLVICRQRPETAGGVVFITLEDESGFVNLIVHHKKFDEYRRILLTSPFLGVTGRVQSTENVVHILVESCWVPRLSEQPVRRESRDFH